MKRTGATAALALLLLPAAVYGLKIQNDYDPTVEFLNFTSYAWSDGVQLKGSTLHDRIVARVETELATGYLRSIQSNPDLYVTYHASSLEELQIDTSRWGYSFGPRWQWGGGMGKSTTTVQTYPEGTLVVDLWEAKTRRLVWRGVATNAIGPDATKSAEKIQKAVRDMFQKFPPQPR